MKRIATTALLTLALVVVPTAIAWAHVPPKRWG